MEHLADTIGENRFARQKKGKEKRKERERIVDRYSFDDIEGSLQFFFVCFFLGSFYFSLSCLSTFQSIENSRGRIFSRYSRENVFEVFRHETLEEAKPWRWNLGPARRTLNVLNNSGCLINRGSDKKARNDEIMCSSPYSRLLSLLCHYFYSISYLYTHIYIHIHYSFFPTSTCLCYKIRLDQPPPVPLFRLIAPIPAYRSAQLSVICFCFNLLNTRLLNRSSPARTLISFVISQICFIHSGIQNDFENNR